MCGPALAGTTRPVWGAAHQHPSYILTYIHNTVGTRKSHGLNRIARRPNRLRRAGTDSTQLQIPPQAPKAANRLNNRARHARKTDTAVHMTGHEGHTEQEILSCLQTDIQTYSLHTPGGAVALMQPVGIAGGNRIELRNMRVSVWRGPLQRQRPRQKGSSCTTTLLHAPTLVAPRPHSLRTSNSPRPIPPTPAQYTDAQVMKPAHAAMAVD